MDKEKIHQMYVESIRKSKRCEPFPGVVQHWEYFQKDFLSAEGLNCNICILLGSEEHDGKAWPKGRCLIRISNRGNYSNYRIYHHEYVTVPETEDVFDVVNESINAAQKMLPKNQKYLADMETTELRSILETKLPTERPKRL